MFFCMFFVVFSGVVFFSKKTWFFAGATHYAAVWVVAAVEVAFRSIPVRSESAKSDPNEPNKNDARKPEKIMFLLRSRDPRNRCFGVGPRTIRTKRVKENSSKKT